VDGLRRALNWTLAFVVIGYLVLCFVNGFEWSARISSSYGLRIIRLVVVTGLAVVSVFTILFQNFADVVYYVTNIAALVFPLALAGRLARSLGARTKLSLAPDELGQCEGGLVTLASGIALVVTVLVVTINLGVDEATDGVFAYLSEATTLRNWVFGVGAFLVLAGVLRPGQRKRAKSTVPDQEPVASERSEDEEQEPVMAAAGEREAHD
jgi:hypothetical protein